MCKKNGDIKDDQLENISHEDMTKDDQLENKSYEDTKDDQLENKSYEEDDVSVVYTPAIHSLELTATNMSFQAMTSSEVQSTSMIMRFQAMMTVDSYPVHL